ncbi:protein toll-like [Vanessa atalanta]|uniref:protein toll-like n=1 Tax=Vanessa atalanta TaxID=42275 RepID=UPI001FCCD157|nr:protein toll-like [Vanessa atalanta]XP_047531638.1 protein toll-like [Vanessa atalanta]
MDCKLIHVLIVALTAHVINGRVMCPSHPNCVCSGTFAVELNCNIDGRTVKINLLPSTYINIKCENATSLDYSKLPKCANEPNTFKSVSFKDCPLPDTSFNDILRQIGVSKTMSLIFQNAKNLSGYFNRKHFTGLKDLRKLLLSVNGITHLPDNLFMDINNLTWLNIRCNNINLSEELFKPLERLETLEISHNHMTNMSSNLFSHLSLLRKLSLWQSNVTWFSKDFFTGVDVLEELDLSSNGLNELPMTIFKPLRKLKKLTLFSNKFSTLPQNLFSTNEKLETVIILNNDVKIKTLPKNMFGNLSNLKQVYLQRSGVEVIPYDIFVNSSLITNISLAYNDIAVIPESTFNDQINLLELDLSHNNLRSLESKLFSSLVRLEILNLCYNSIEEVSSVTFSSLLSLIYLNMEHNNLKIISSDLFSSNKQRMSITLAYNRLDFENKELKNNSWAVTRSSPFAHTYNLRMLNLSHNKFKHSFDDWWINGHENLDISFNSIQYLWGYTKYSIEDGKSNYEEILKKPLKEVWISNNPLNCRCRNFLFIDYLKDNLKSKVMDDTLIHCPIWTREACYLRFIIFISVVTTSVSLSTITLILYFIYKNQINSMIKRRFKYFSRQDNTDQYKNILIKYSENDEEFVLKEILPELKNHKNFNVQTKLVKTNSKDNFIKHFANGSKENDTVVIIFSPNYLTSAYSHVNIKKIRGEMLKTKNTLYVFTDIGPENSIYAFLKEQRDQRTAILWSDPNFWNVLISMLSNGYKKKVRFSPGIDIRSKLNTSLTSSKSKLASNSSFTRLPDWPDVYASSTFAHSQV